MFFSVSGRVLHIMNLNGRFPDDVQAWFCTIDGLSDNKLRTDRIIAVSLSSKICYLQQYLYDSG